MYRTDGVLGGSIWSGIDDIFQLPDGNAVGYGAWGVIDGWRRMKPEYWDMKKIFSPVKILTKSLEPACSFVIEAENRFTFTNFSELSWNGLLEKKVVAHKFNYSQDREVSSVLTSRILMPAVSYTCVSRIRAELWWMNI